MVLLTGIFICVTKRWSRKSLKSLSSYDYVSVATSETAMINDDAENTDRIKLDD